MVSLKKSEQKKRGKSPSFYYQFNNLGMAEMLTPIRASRRIQAKLQKKLASENAMDIEDGFQFSTFSLSFH